jgi:hypothetical protein
MKIHFKITSSLLATVRIDLHRPHRFAAERVGFIAAGICAAGRDLLILARTYRAVHDDDYLPDRSVGVMMGPEAIRKAMQWAMQDRCALFHVHSHSGQGIPGFSGIDLRENARFVPDFLKVAPHCVHGAIVLSDTAARGQVWLDRERAPSSIHRFTEVGAPIRTWSPA